MKSKGLIVKGCNVCKYGNVYLPNMCVVTNFINFVNYPTDSLQTAPSGQILAVFKRFTLVKYI